MILLVVVAMGLLSLSTITLRTTGNGNAPRIARANARMAMMLAVGELQKTMGDDRRVSADGSIYNDAKYGSTVGVWKGWSPEAANSPLKRGAGYAAAKGDGGFVGWLTSSTNPDDLTSVNWAKSGNLANEIDLFTLKNDGLVASASKVEVLKGKAGAGAMAWTVVQDATRAKINIGGPENGTAIPNDRLQAQARPSLHKADHFKQPADGWNKRANRVISLNQAKLDNDLWKGGKEGTPEYADFTSQGRGLITDVVKGGFKTDMTLGFEMSEADFEQDQWGAFTNPFRAASVSRNAGSYKGERPLFNPLTASGSVNVTINFSPASTNFNFPAAAVPTFTTLRSYYRTPWHMYDTPDGPAVFERGMDNVSLTRSSGGTPPPGLTPAGTDSQTSYRPVLDRVLYLLSIGTAAGEPGLVFTPVITLWNPYNVALEMEGAVVYPWMDLPFRANWTFVNGSTTSRFETSLSRTAGHQFISQGHGRTVNPYFYAAMVPSNANVAGGNNTIRFKPGEVRVFAPKRSQDVVYRNEANVSQRTIFMSPVDSISQLPARAGILIRTYNTFNGEGTRKTMLPNETVQVSITPVTGKDYPFSIGMEDATRARTTAGLTDSTRGLLTTDVQTINFVDSAQGRGAVENLVSPTYSYSSVSQIGLRTPFGMIETYHRVASDTQSSRRSDIVYTTNPRQPFVNRYLTTGSFLAGPHYETRVRRISSFQEALQTDNDGRTSFYGLSNSSSGSTQLSFFEAPQQPPLSVASLQHADMAGTCYSSGNQVGNSWASAYLPRGSAALLVSAGSGASTGEATFQRGAMPIYDYSYLANEELWDSFFFSGASSVLSPGTVTRSSTAWSTGTAEVKTEYKKMLEDFIDNPDVNPLRNTRMRLDRRNMSAASLKDELAKPEGCLKIASHLSIDGAFNINSTSVKAWIALLSGLRGESFTVRDGEPPSSTATAFPRFRDPLGEDTDKWQGFRSLSDQEIETLAENIVIETRARGPFLSLGEFVNRRLDSSVMALKGGLQAAIDKSGVNSDALFDLFSTSAYPVDGRANVSPANTGVGIPGYLTQADVLQSIGPVITPRSDTFTVRAYGEAKDALGKVTATSWCEAVVQRLPEFVNPEDSPEAAIASLKPVNQIFGRRFAIISFRYLSDNEVAL